MDLEKYLYDKIVPIIRSWNEKGIYAISFLVYANASSVYKGFCNFPQVSVGYNTEEDCSGAALFDEERWNFAFWRQNNEYIIDPAEAADGAEFLMNWYRLKGIDNIGFEDADAQYDENMNYIGKGPVGYYEVLCAVSNVAKQIQKKGIIAGKFGRIPIIVHDLEYSWYVEDATRNANPGGEADVFLDYLHKLHEAFHDNDKDNGELTDIEDSEEFEKLLTSINDEEINSLDDAINMIDKFSPFVQDEELIAEMRSVLVDVFTFLDEAKKDSCDDADTK